MERGGGGEGKEVGIDQQIQNFTCCLIAKVCILSHTQTTKHTQNGLVVYNADLHVV